MFGVAFALACALGSAEPPTLRLPLPPDRLGGRAWIERIRWHGIAEREQATAEAIMAGHVPRWLRRLRPVTLRGSEGEITLWVTPDVLAVGSDTDWVRMPMTPRTAQAIADATDATLITDRISDAIHAAADLRLDPYPLTMLREATSTFLQHHELIEAARGPRMPGELVAGIKKDVVLTNRLLERPARVAIYGWHYRDGRPIQPLSIVHGDTYVDYSHGIRLAARRCRVNGEERDLREVLRDPRYSPLLASDGPLRLTSYAERPSSENAGTQ